MGTDHQTSEVAVRAEWYLREHGRLPTVDELVAIGKHEQAEGGRQRRYVDRTPADVDVTDADSDDVP